MFGPLEFSRRDLMAVNILRGRDHGLPDYNTARKQFRLPVRTTFASINQFNGVAVGSPLVSNLILLIEQCLLQI